MENKKQIIIFEGLNCVGKSSIISDLRDGFDIPYVHNKRSDFKSNHMMDTIYGYTKALLDVIKGTEEPMWFDRFHFTETTYGIVRRQYNDYTAIKLFEDIDNQLFDMGAKVVYLTDDLNNIWERTQKYRGWGDYDLIRRLSYQMELCVERTILPVFSINYNDYVNNEEHKKKLIEYCIGEKL